MNNKKWRRLATVVLLVLALLTFWAAKSGRLGERAADSSAEYLIVAMCILVLRVFVTEREARRTRHTFEQRKK